MRPFFILIIRRTPNSTPLYSSAASDVYKRQPRGGRGRPRRPPRPRPGLPLSLIHISEPTRLRRISYAVFCLKKKTKKKKDPPALLDMYTNRINHTRVTGIR